MKNAFEIVPSDFVIDNAEFWGRQLAVAPIDLHDEEACLLSLVALKARAKEINAFFERIVYAAKRARECLSETGVCYG